MNDAEVSKQVQQMVQFIKQEAEEKANEISVAAEEVRESIYLFKIADLRVYATDRRLFSKTFTTQ